MDWSREQQSALDRVGQWLRAGEPQVFRLFGYAGVGKTTLARHIAAGLARRGGLRRLHRQGGAGDALEGLRRGHHHPRADLSRERGRRRRAEIQAQSRRAGLARRPHRDRRMFDGRRRARPRPPVFRQADPGARRSRAIAPRQGRRLLHRSRAGHHAHRRSIGRRRTIRSFACRSRCAAAASSPMANMARAA